MIKNNNKLKQRQDFWLKREKNQNLSDDHTKFKNKVFKSG